MLAVISVVVVAAVPVAATVVPPGGREVVAETVGAGIVVLVDVRSVESQQDCDLPICSILRLARSQMYVAISILTYSDASWET